MRTVGKTLIVVVTLLMLAAGCSAWLVSTIDASSGNPIPQLAADVDPTLDAPDEKPEETYVTSCDVAREAFLTGSKGDVRSALAALVKDTTADGTAREYADYWLNRDAYSADQRDMDQTLIMSACSL